MSDDKQLSGPVVCEREPSPHWRDSHGGLRRAVRGAATYCVNPRPASPIPGQTAQNPMARISDYKKTFNEHTGEAIYTHIPSSERALAPSPSAAPAQEEQQEKHWPDCAMNHGGAACDMGPDCGTTGQLTDNGWIPAPAREDDQKALRAALEKAAALIESARVLAVHNQNQSSERAFAQGLKDIQRALSGSNAA